MVFSKEQFAELRRLSTSYRRLHDELLTLLVGWGLSVGHARFLELGEKAVGLAGPLSPSSTPRDVAAAMIGAAWCEMGDAIAQRRIQELADNAQGDRP